VRVIDVPRRLSSWLERERERRGDRQARQLSEMSECGNLLRGLAGSIKRFKNDRDDKRERERHASSTKSLVKKRNQRAWIPVDRSDDNERNVSVRPRSVTGVAAAYRYGKTYVMISGRGEAGGVGAGLGTTTAFTRVAMDDNRERLRALCGEDRACAGRKRTRIAADDETSEQSTSG